MNKKIIATVTSGILFILFSAIIYLNQGNSKTPTDTDSPEEIEDIAIDGERVDQKIDQIRKRLTLKGLIEKGDIHLENKEYTTALTKYLQIIKDLPGDENIINKIGDTYFHLKKYKQAYKYYTSIKSYGGLDKNRAILALIYSEPLSKENVVYILAEIKDFDITDEQRFYYTNSLSCAEDFSLCKENFQKYFAENITEEQPDKENITEIGFPELKNIENAFMNYKNFQLDDVSYKNALISGAFFENALYPIAISTSGENLKEKPDYKPIVKIIAKSHFELGNYLESKKYLVQYNGFGDQEPEISYSLGVVYEKLHEYILSTIHLKKALSYGYYRIADVRRRIIYNYYKLGEMEKTLIVFRALVYENGDTITSQDYNLAVFYHILNDRLSDAEEINNIALSKFPADETFYGYKGWIILQNESLENYLVLAEESLQKGLELGAKNPMISLIMGKLEIKKGDRKKALAYFKRTLSLDKTGDFGKTAEEEIKNIEELIQLEKAQEFKDN